MEKNYESYTNDALVIERVKLNAKIDAIKADIATIDGFLLRDIPAGESKEFANGKYKVAHTVVADGIVIDPDKAKGLIKNWEKIASKVRRGYESIRVTIKK